MGNQVSSEKIKNINSLESLNYTPDTVPDQTEDIVVEDPQTLENDDENGQITLEL
jgi:topoisomerase-4 subunit A